jgi:hypothetical protein
MGSVIARICRVSCHNCGWDEVSRYWHVDRIETQKCTVCGSDLIIGTSDTKSSGVLFGGFSDDPTSDLYIRPDKDHPNERARREKRDMHIIEGLESEGKTPRLKDVTGKSDFDSAKRRIRRYETEDRQR